MKQNWKEVDNEHVLATDHIKIYVHRHVDHNPSVWVVSCASVDLLNKELHSESEAQAKEEALEIVKQKLALMLEGLS